MVRISADSTCDLSPDIVKRFGVFITPLSITVGEEVFKDGVDLTPAQLIAYSEAGKKCQTGAVNVFEYQQYFQELTANGEWSTSTSPGFSCYNNALLALGTFPA